MGVRHTPEMRASAKFYYIIERKSIDEICTLLRISRATLDRWRKSGGWDNERELEVIETSTIVRSLRKQIAAKLKEVEDANGTLNSKDMDGLHKTYRMIEGLNGGAVLASHTIRIMDMFMSWLSEQRPDLYKELIPIIAEFTTRVVKANSA